MVFYYHEHLHMSQNLHAHSKVSMHGHSQLKMGHHCMYENLDTFHFLFQKDDDRHIVCQVLFLLLCQNPILNIFLALLLS